MPAFKVGKYVVTNAQYVRFVQATQRRWDSSDTDAPELRNHPARYMSWHDALAYCSWQTNEWQQAGRIAANEAVTLPSEAEWERAARSMDDGVARCAYRHRIRPASVSTTSGFGWQCGLPLVAADPKSLLDL